MTAAIAFDIANLPALLVSTIRHGSWKSPNAATLRRIARSARVAQDVGFPMDHILTVLAGAARADMPVPNTDWSPEMIQMERMIHPFLASSLAMRCERETAEEYGIVRTVDEAADVVTSIITDERARHAVPADEADRIIREEMERVSALHPELGLSYGYIGNIWHGPYQDDRLFRVFTRLRDARGHSICFGGHALENLPELAFMAQRRLASWAVEQSARLAPAASNDDRAVRIAA